MWAWEGWRGRREGKAGGYRVALPLSRQQMPTYLPSLPTVAVLPPFSRLPSPDTRQPPTRVIRSAPGRDTTSASQGCPSCETPGTQPHCWLGHHTHTLPGIPGQVPSRGRAHCGSPGWSDHTPGAGHRGPRREILDASRKGGDPVSASRSCSSHMTLCCLETLIWEQPGEPII